MNGCVHVRAVQSCHYNSALGSWHINETVSGQSFCRGHRMLKMQPKESRYRTYKVYVGVCVGLCVAIVAPHVSKQPQRNNNPGKWDRSRRKAEQEFQIEHWGSFLFICKLQK